jgi:hypothetical protein
MRPILKGSTSHSEFVVLRDSTTGLGKTGLVFTDITGSYTRQRATRTAVTMATLASASAAFSSGGFVEVDGTNCKGLYRIDVPDAAFATGVDQVVVSVAATGAITEHKEFRLVDVNDQDSVRFGLTALPNAAAAATGGLATVDASNAVKVQSGTGANQISLSSGTVTVGTNNDKTGYGLSAAAVQAVWDALTSALTTAGSIGKLLVDNINATISSRLASASYTSPPSAATISTTVWTEPVPGAFGAGSAGATLAAAGSAGDPWATALPGAYSSGTAGNIVGNRLDAAVTSRLAPTTAGRTLDVAATGEAGLDFDNIHDASGAHTLTNITVPTVTTTTTATNLTTNNDKTGYALTSGERTAIATAIMKLDVSTITGEASQSPLNALRFLRNKWTLVGTTLTVYKEDGSTTAWSETVATTGGAAPITSTSG